MLASLHIENIALIRRLDLELKADFCAFTGETGAGKSILIDSIGLLCGARVEKELIRSGESYALVEGMFYPSDDVKDALRELEAEPDEDGALFLQRRMTEDGRSSAKINGRTVPLAKLRETAALLLSLHGQQDTQSLAAEEKQRRLLDAFASDEPLLDAYRETYNAFTALQREANEAKKQAEELEERRDLLSYQVKELTQASIRVGEEAELLAEHTLLANREKIIENANAVYDALYGEDRSAVACLQTARSAMRSLSGLLPEGEQLQTRLEDASAELTDIAESLRAYADPSEGSAERLTYVEERLDRLSALQRKYRTDEAGLLEKLQNASHALETLENSNAAREETEKKRKQLQAELQARAEALHTSRERAAKLLAQRVQDALALLDMPSVRFVIDLEETEAYGAYGADTVCFTVSANAGEEPRPIGKIASGGELSRIMLCLQCVLADVENIHTLIFDEIDTGISGKTNEKIGHMMQQIASRGHAQVICVTHAAQLAACAAHQYRISKQERNGRTETDVRLLSDPERVEELSRIMGGVNVTDTVRKAAGELLEANRSDGAPSFGKDKTSK